MPKQKKPPGRKGQGDKKWDNYVDRQAVNLKKAICWYKNGNLDIEYGF